MNETSKQPRVLIVEDDASLAAMVSDFLSSNDFAVSTESHGDKAVDRILSDQPDVVLLDINLPGLDGFGVCKAVRSRYAGAILILTASGDEVDEVVGLELGADDYMAKPVRPRALLARVRSHLRRTTPIDSDTGMTPIVVGSLVIEPSRRSVHIGDEAIDLTTAEFDLLYFLAKSAGQTVSRNDIYLALHEMRYDGLDRSIDLRVSRLRKKLGDDPVKPDRIKSIRGVGYMLVLDP